MGKTECFISQCHDDDTLVSGLQAILNAAFDPAQYTFFNTQQEENSTAAGSLLNPELYKHIQSSSVMIAVVTDSYVRSALCLAELSTYWMMGKYVIPLVFSPAAEHLLTKDLGISKMLYVDLKSAEPANAAKMAKKLINSLKGQSFVFLDEAAARKSLAQLFAEVRPKKPTRAYLGSLDTYENINSYCTDYGISRLSNSSLSSYELDEHLAAFQEIYILATTGSGLITNLASQFLPAALARGVNFYILIPNRYSDYINDVAEIESPDGTESHKQRFAQEFDLVIHNLQDCLRRSRRINREAQGQVYVGCAYTLLRQTITLGKNGDRLWGWMSLTMPPSRTVHGTPSFEFSGKLGEPSIASIAYDHILAVRDIAQRRRSYYCLSEHSELKEFFLEKESARRYWKALQDQARINTIGRQSETDLIEVAAQHPLRSNGTPSIEFARRLDRAYALYQELQAQGQEVKIYVPGSLHCYKKKADPCALSDAGVAYLLEKGVPSDDLLGNDANMQYKGDAGVYNTADECYVASQLFLEGDFRRLHCICSPNQLMRKKLFYLAFGVIPFFYTVNCEQLAHDDIYELFDALPDVLFRDHTWQGTDSENGNRTRDDRDPRRVFGKSTRKE